MLVRQTPLVNKEQTGKEMHRLIRNYHKDLKDMYLNDSGKARKMSKVSLSCFFDFVKNIPYVQDIPPIEIIKRPKIIIGDSKKGVGADCKKKAILISSFLVINGCPYRLIASSSRKDKRIHHVFPQGQVNGEWINLDATYRIFRIGEQKRITKAELI